MNYHPPSLPCIVIQSNFKSLKNIYFFQGEVKCRLLDGTRPVPELLWMDGRVGENNGHLLLALHLPSTLILWDTGSGQQVLFELELDSVFVLILRLQL